jgi:hypothetical protein
MLQNAFVQAFSNLPFLKGRQGAGFKAIYSETEYPCPFPATRLTHVLQGRPVNTPTFVGGDDDGLAVHQRLARTMFTAQRRADALVAQADTQDGQLAGESLDRLDRNARLGRRTRAGRNTSAVRLRAALAFASVISSLRSTRTSSPSSPKYCTRL